MINIKKYDVPELPLFQSCYVTINNIRLHYIIGGSGSVIMLIHTLAEENPEGTVKHILNFIQK